MSNALANVYSFGNKLRNNLRSLVADPAGHMAGQLNAWAADMNRALDSPATAYRRAGGVMADDPSTVAAAQREQMSTLGALMGAAPGFVGMTAWHGSPHKFDRFDSSKIGTGEGAQAYGHGLYLAESPGVAKSYAQVLPSRVDTPEFWADKSIPKALSAREFDEFGLLVRKMQKNGNLPEPEMARWRELNDIRSAHSAAIEAQRPSSNLYKVDLPDEMVARMLDWDKPLSQQAPEIQDVFGGAAKHLQLGTLEGLTGKDIYRRMHEAAILQGKPKPAAVKEAEMVRGLRAAGIPGIRYLDGGSRNALQGTSNFVIFPGEESALRILERNGVSLADMMRGQSLAR